MTIAIEKTVQDSSPIELYEFRWGERTYGENAVDETIYLTNHDAQFTVIIYDIIYDNDIIYDIIGEPRTVTFLPVAISHGAVDKTDQIDDASQIAITIERGNPLERFLATTDISKDVRVRISVAEVDTISYTSDNPIPLASTGVWSGLMSSHFVNPDSFGVNCSTIGATLSATGVSMRYQRSCPWPVYERGCRLKMADFATTVTVLEIDGSSVTVSPHGKPDGYFNGGVMKLGAAQRFIVGHVGEVLVLSSNYLSIDAGDSVVIHPGCDRSAQACMNKFNNILNFGGLSYNPPTSPFGSSGFI